MSSLMGRASMIYPHRRFGRSENLTPWEDRMAINLQTGWGRIIEAFSDFLRSTSTACEASNRLSV